MKIKKNLTIKTTRFSFYLVSRFLSIALILMSSNTTAYQIENKKAYRAVINRAITPLLFIGYTHFPRYEIFDSSFVCPRLPANQN